MIIKEVSIIIPFFNEEKRVKKTIGTIKNFLKKIRALKQKLSLLMMEAQIIRKLYWKIFLKNYY